ncbi:MAG: hypothetical protein OEW24_06815 [Chloroflexota bacterium]|nr:hypothetical protein [Chloroflexota bacterium]
MASAFLSWAVSWDLIARRALIAVLFITALMAVASAVLMVTTGSPTGIEAAGNSWSFMRVSPMGNSWSF